MKTVLFSGLAAATMMFVGTSANANDSPNIDAYHGQPEYGPSMRPDVQAYNWGDNSDVAFAAPDGSSYSYDGEWQGEYVDPDGQVFEGEWQGTVTRRGGVSGPGYPVDRADDDYDYDDYEISQSRSGARYQSQGYSHQQYGWQGGYYYYPQAPMVSVTVIPSMSHTTTVTEETYYETVHVAPRKRAVRKWKPKPKPRCVC